MMKQRLTLSLVAMIGSVLLFVVASFAWFAVSDIVDVGSNTLQIINIDVSAILYESDNGVDYTSTNNIEMTNTVPGDIKYYKVVVTNNNDFDVYTQVSLHGFTDTYTDASGDTSNYAGGQTLLDVIILNASNNIDSATITDTALTSLLQASSFVVTHENVLVSAGGSAEFYFSFTISGAAGNDYQNLRLDIDNLFVQSVQ